MNVGLSEEALDEKAVVTRQFPLHWVLLALVVVAVITSLYTYLFAKNYDFLIEASCDAATQQCYVRDCSTGDCPPNNLSAYVVYSVPASVFSSCADNACSNICAGWNSPCKAIPCSSQTDIECSEPLALQ